MQFLDVLLFLEAKIGMHRKKNKYIRKEKRGMKGRKEGQKEKRRRDGKKKKNKKNKKNKKKKKNNNNNIININFIFLQIETKSPL